MLRHFFPEHCCHFPEAFSWDTSAPEFTAMGAWKSFLLVLVLMLTLSQLTWPRGHYCSHHCLRCLFAIYTAAAAAAATAITDTALTKATATPRKSSGVLSGCCCSCGHSHCCCHCCHSSPAYFQHH